MPRKKKDPFSDIIMNVGLSSSKDLSGTEIVNIIEMIESNWGFNFKLYPVQRFILKAYYGLPLEKKKKTIVLTDWRRNVLGKLTEVEYLQHLYDEGRCNLNPSTYQEGEEKQEMILSIGRRSGKCVAGNTFLKTKKGLKRIKEFYQECNPEEKKMQGLDETYPLEREIWDGESWKKTSHFLRSEKKPTYKVKTYSGYHITGTANHRIRNSEGEWVHLDKIEEGETLRIAKGYWNPGKKEYLSFSRRTSKTSSDPVYNRTTELDESHAFLLGFLCCTGYPSRKFELCIKSNNEVIIEKARKYIKEKAKNPVYEFNHTGVPAVFTHYKYLRRIYGDFGWGTSYTASKEFVPSGILRSNLSVVKSFITGVFDAIGNIRDEKFFEFKFKREHQAQDFQQFLLALGVETFLENTRKEGEANLFFKYRLYGSLKVLTDFYNAETITPSFIEDVVKNVGWRQDEVFDFEVPSTHSFLGNGIINHNTLISSCIAGYETYRLIMKGDPQNYYGMPSSAPIDIISVATDKKQAGILYQNVSGYYQKCSFFHQYMANQTQSFAKFQTPKDVELFGSYIENEKARSSIEVTFRSCIAKGLRGGANIVIILDEVAHFTDEGSSQSSAESVWQAVRPSISTFSPKDKNSKPIGPLEAKVILISSPLGKNGLFYDRFNIGMKGGIAGKNILSIQAPTWEVNPTIPAEEFETNYASNAHTFFVEYGGQFSDRTRGWIEEEDILLEVVDPDREAQQNGPPRRSHFIGIDFALSGDGTAIAIGHVEDGKLIVDLVDWIRAGHGRYKDEDRLKFDAVIDWVYQLSRKFYIKEGIFDQWAGQIFEQKLHQRGLKQIKTQSFNPTLKSQIFKNFKDLLWEKRISLHAPRLNEDGKNYIEELLSLQAEQKNEYQISVEAPRGGHDDRSDALVRMAWVATPYLDKMNFSSMTHSKKVISGRSQRESSILRSRRKNLRSGSDPKRMIPRRRRY